MTANNPLYLTSGRILKMPLLLTLFLLLSTLSLSAQENYILHTVLKGQGLYSISRMYGVTEQEIIALNPGSDEVIKAGEQLRIPVHTAGGKTTVTTTDGEVLEAPEGCIAHRVKRGETLYRLTVIYGVSGVDIHAANPSLTSDGLREGDVIYIPVTKAPEKADNTAAAEGETATEDDDTAERKRFSIRSILRAARGEEATADDSDDALTIGGYRVRSAYDADEQERLEQAKAKKATAQTQTATSSTTTPQCKEEHTVRLFETVYSLARRYGITQDELLAANPDVAQRGLKRGQVICIPYTAGELAAMQVGDAIPAAADNDDDDDNNNNDVPDVHTLWDGINVAVILPFQLSTTATNADKAKMVEYYEGLLLAVDSLKHKGTSINLYAYDSGDAASSIADILASDEMAHMDILFGPVHPAHIAEASAFVQQHRIPMVLPFARGVKQLTSNPMIYQVNVEQDDLDGAALQHFFTAFSRPNVLFFEEKGEKASTFATQLQKELTDRSFHYVTLPADTTSFVGDLVAHFDTEADNIVMVGTADREGETLARMMPVFQLMARDTVAAGRMHLFGYPQYQVYAATHMDACHEVDTWFYTSFYTNNLLPDAVAFHRLFRHTYSRDITARYPKYAILGFDTGYYFLNALSHHTTQPSAETLADLSRYVCPTIQTGFRYERVGDEGGWLNHKAYLIHIGSDERVRRIDYD